MSNQFHDVYKISEQVIEVFLESCLKQRARFYEATCIRTEEKKNRSVTLVCRIRSKEELNLDLAVDCVSYVIRM